MCGICGMLSLNMIDEETAKKFQSIMTLCESRGTHAFGYTTSDNTIFKTTGSVSEYTKDHPEMYKNFVGKHLVLAHTRFATHGSAKEQKNNHPFETKDFILAHNGIINNHEEFKYKDGIETDSYAIISGIQELFNLYKGKDTEKAITNAIRETSQKLSGCFACWLLHKKTGDVYLFRTDNPIEIAFSPTSNAIFFASERNMFYPILSYLKLNTTFSGGLFFTTIEENTIYKINKKGIKKLETYKPKVVYYNCVSPMMRMDFTKEDEKLIRSQNEDNKVEEYITEKDLQKSLLKEYNINLDNLKKYLESFDMSIELQNKKIYVKFDKTIAYNYFANIFDVSGYAIDIDTKTIKIPNLAKLVYLADIVEDTVLEANTGSDFENATSDFPNSFEEERRWGM